MIDIISGADLRRLAEVGGIGCVSLYTSTHRAGGEAAQDPIRWKNLVRAAQHELEELGMRRPEAERRLAPASALADDEHLWANAADGLAVLVWDGAEAVYRLTGPLEELVVVSDRLHLRPLLTRAGERTFHVLVLGEREARLLRGTRTGIAEIGHDQMVHSREAALRFDDREAELHSHAGPRDGAGRVTATFHGQGARKDTREYDRKRYFARIDAGVREVLAGSDSPVVLAGVGDTVARYRRLTELPHVIEEAIEGNAEHASLHELHARALALVETHVDDDRLAVREAFDAGSVPTVSTVAEAVTAARTGRVAALFVPTSEHRWGTVRDQDGEVEEHDDRRPGDRDLLDAAAIETLAHAGDVYAVDPADVPGGGPVAAALRF